MIVQGAGAVLDDVILRDFAKSVRSELDLAVFALSLTSDGDIKLGLIKVDQEHRDRGAGSAAMRRLCDFADRVGRRVILITPRHTHYRLVKFYRRFGFVLNQGSQKDRSLYATMYRPPQV